MGTCVGCGRYPGIVCRGGIKACPICVVRLVEALVDYKRRPRSHTAAILREVWPMYCPVGLDEALLDIYEMLRSIGVGSYGEEARADSDKVT